MMRGGKVKRTGGKICRLLALGLALGGAALSASGCSIPVMGAAGTEEAEEVLVLVEKPDEDESAYTLTEVALADVEKTASVRFSYTQARSEDVLFPLSGRRVWEVYVKLGDRVEEGQLLAVLEGSQDREEDIRELEYQIARSRIQDSYLDLNEAYEVSGRLWKLYYQSGRSEEEQEKAQNDVDAIRQNYRYKREDYQDIQEMAQIRLETYRKEMEEGRIYAGMDGVIYRLGGDMETIISDVSKPAFTIIDDSHCLFESSDMSYAEYFTEGEVYELVRGVGASARTYLVSPWSKAAWEDRIYLELIEEEGGESVEVGTYAYLTLTLEKRENVLAVKKSAIHIAEGKSYVYVLGENDIRDVRWVETGLQGDTLTEIVSGLEEGEAVILK